MAKLTIKEENCKGCGLCVHACPKNVLALKEDVTNAKGYFPVYQQAPQDCVGCAACAIMCPDCVIEVER